MSASARAWWLAAGVAGLVLAADQVTKAIVESDLVPGEKVDVLGPLQLTLAHNEGVAFGLAGGAGVPLVLLTVVALGAVGVMFARRPTRPGMWVATGLVAGGAVGNLVDRVRAGAVTDFIDVGSWPPFNLADIAVVAGALLLVLIYMRDAEGARAGA